MLQLRSSAPSQQFMMVSTKTPDGALSDYYVGLPSDAFLVGFDGFEVVAEADLPKEIDALDFGIMVDQEFTSRFTIKRRR
jgi:hypothetical protein